MTMNIDQFLEDYRIVEGGTTIALDDRTKGIVKEAITAYMRGIGVEAEDLLPVGAAVRWTSSGTLKRGHVVAHVPAGKRPADVGHPKAGGGGMSRDHVSYVLKGRRIDTQGKAVGSAALYWPHANLVEPDSDTTV